MENQVLIALKNNKLLQNILFEDFDLANIKGNLLTLSEGEILYREGEEDENIYLVVSGEINLFKKKQNNKSESVICADNDFFGCDEFIEKSIRKTTAVALRDSYIIALSREEIDSLIEQNYDVLNNMYASISKTNLNSSTSDGIDTPLPGGSGEESNFETSDEGEPDLGKEITDSFELLYSEEIKPENGDPTGVGDKAIDENLTIDEPGSFIFESTAEEPGEKDMELSDDFSFDDKSWEMPAENPSEQPEPADSSFDSVEPFYIGGFDNLQGSAEQEPKTPGDEENFDFSKFDFNTYDEKISPDQIRNDEINLGELEKTPESNIIKPFDDEDDHKRPGIFDENFMDDIDLQIKKDGVTLDKIKSDDIMKPEETKSETEETSPVSEGSPFTAEQLAKINDAAQLVNSNITIDEVLQSIVKVACELTNADRGTLYLVDKSRNELWSKVAIGSEFKEIKVAIGEGISGYVAQRGEILNIENVQEDTRFNTKFDKSSGYVTKSMLTFPIRNKTQDIVGVLQLLNSKSEKFTKLDEEFLAALSTHAALALQNAELVEQLLSSERVTSLGKMANFLLQDIKKPILVSKRYAEHLKTKETPEEVTKVIDMLLEQLNHVVDLVQATSSYSEGQIVLRSILRNLNQALDDCVARIDSYVRSRDCRIIKEYDKDISVKISEKQFYQAFQNIIKNSCDAMPEGGDITLSTKRVDNSVNIIIRDKGIGIPLSLLEKIFEPFVSHGKKEGVGLGLSIAKKIIEEHGGKISVQSEIGEGTSLTITLPANYSSV